MFIATLVLSALLAVAFIGAGVSKVMKVPAMVAAAETHGFTADGYRNIGLLEVAGAAGLLIGLWWAPLGIAAALGLTLLMAGAVIVHVRAGDKVAETVPAVVLTLLAGTALVLRIVTA
ncbi:DoxX family protein [Lentzea sp. BCCO 10_0061]|uniref:DoxX family protein n=1 Tax=Lentzea sokolovensis TaxID=3095429 RepID=A0ABU4UP16_9PSEU|nr:DoxX family protein [Lentzea sp. BCCO 10_0061]MDX8140583.1 DoxX family protein [Lentzea sp. BCCO 10_0061]